MENIETEVHPGPEVFGAEKAYQIFADIADSLRSLRNASPDLKDLAKALGIKFGNDGKISSTKKEARTLEGWRDVYENSIDPLPSKRDTQEFQGLEDSDE